MQAIDSSKDINIKNAEVQILNVAKESPAEIAGLKIGDNILEIKNNESSIVIESIKDIQNYINDHKGENIVLTIERWKEVFERKVFARENYPNNEGSIGISLAKVGIISYPWDKAIIKGF